MLYTQCCRSQRCTSDVLQEIVYRKRCTENIVRKRWYQTYYTWKSCTENIVRKRWYQTYYTWNSCTANIVHGITVHELLYMKMLYRKRCTGKNVAQGYIVQESVYIQCCT